jgi:hypothetical protein
MADEKCELLSFDAAIESTGVSCCTLLLGNGFSIAQGGRQFAYRSLLEKSGLPEGSAIRNVFDVLETFDFEKVMKALRDAAQIELAYNDEEKSRTFTNDAAAVREALISAVRAVHPDVHFDIPKPQRDACAKFLKHFHAIFTLNYDLLLYWVILHAASRDFQDGFGLGGEVNGFRTFSEAAYCNTYYLHGALHLFANDELLTQKRVLENQTIIDDIATTIRQRRQLPLFVAEGTTTEKLARIRSVPYLAHCYKELSQIKRNPFIFGHAASANDAHVYDAICASGLDKVFICIHDPVRNLTAMRESLARYVERAKKIEWLYVDAASANLWSAPL